MHLMIVEDRGLVPEGFRLIVEGMGRFERTVECGSVAAALAQASAMGPELGLVLLDLELPDATGFDGLVRVVAACPDVPVVVVSGDDAIEIIHAAFAHGARGYVPKSASGPVFRAAVEAVLCGELSMPPHVLARGTPATPPPSGTPATPPPRVERTKETPPPPLKDAVDRLTPRQEDVLALVARGLSDKDIARELAMSPATVRVHVASLLKALRVENRALVAGSEAAQHLLSSRAAKP
jgi:DNA-binding NarL/FixJ family response regulator